PPFWFLGIYQRLMEGPAAQPIFGKLAQIGCEALLGTVGLAMLAYPLAYMRKVRQIVVGAPARTTRRGLLRFGNWLAGATIVRQPLRRAIFHFIGKHCCAFRAIEFTSFSMAVSVCRSSSRRFCASRWLMVWCALKSLPTG